MIEPPTWDSFEHLHRVTILSSPLYEVIYTISIYQFSLWVKGACDSCCTVYPKRAFSILECYLPIHWLPHSLHIIYASISFPLVLLHHQWISYDSKYQLVYCWNWCLTCSIDDGSIPYSTL